MLFPIGPSVNGLAIIAGALVGILIGSRLPENIRKTVFQCLGIATLIIGLQMALKTQQPIVLIFSLVIGAVIGEFLQIETHINNFGDFLKRKLKSKNPRFTEGFVSSFLLFCIGAMGILASFDEGLRGDVSVALSKSVLDGISAIAIASAYGVGVVLSGIVVFIYQGIFVIFAGLLQPFIGEVLLNELTAVGGALILGIALNLMNILTIPLANLLPSLVMVVIFVQFL